MSDKPWSKKSPDQRWDYLVIGSGMGGMVAAAMLSELGKRVLVLEQHYVPGGFTHTFRRKEWRWDVGVHAVGEVTEHSMTGRVLRKLTQGSLQWASLGPVYDEFEYPDGFHIDFPDTPEKFRANLKAAFPREHAAIDEYMGLVRSVSRGMKSYYLARALPSRFATAGDLLLARRAQAYLEMRTSEVVARLTQDPHLRAVLVAQWGYYGSPPSRSSFAMQALVTKHFEHGGYYPVGGSQEIARTLLGTVARNGGWTRIHADVEEILVEGDRVRGVRLEGGEEIRADRVISAAGVVSTMSKLLPARFRSERWSSETTRLSPAPAHVCLYVGFEGDIRKAGCGSANKWFYETWDPESDAWAVAKDVSEVPRAPVLYCSFPSLKDPTHDPGPRQLHTGEVVTFVPWETFAPWADTRWQKRGEDYEALKKKLEEKILAQFLEHVPGVRDMVRHAELSTPLSTDHFVRPNRGSIYGLEPTPERFKTPWLRPRAPLQGLFFAGSEVASVGVIGAMVGGLLSVLTAEPLRALAWLRDVL